jgi:exosortase family protein XrtF
MLNILKDARRFKPALGFISRFLIVYVAGNVMYGLFVQYHHPRPDPATVAVTGQSVRLINWFEGGREVSILELDSRVAMVEQNNIIVRVFEGCNGLNVMIVFLAFIIAFSGWRTQILVFVLVGISVIHAMNLTRIILLFYLAKENSPYFYYFHKYIFTSTIYAIVFLLWVVWIYRSNAGKQTYQRSQNSA